MTVSCQWGLRSWGKLRKYAAHLEGISTAVLDVFPGSFLFSIFIDELIARSVDGKSLKISS